MKQLRWQILVVLVTLVIVAVLLFSTQSPGVDSVIQSQPEQGGVYTEGLVGSLGRLNPLLDWNNQADRDINRLLFSEKDRVGIGTFQPKDEKNQDSTRAAGVSTP